MVEKMPHSTRTEKSQTKRADAAVTSARKAPTAIAKEQQERAKSRMLLYGTAAFFFAVVGASVLIGLSDKGQIVVSSSATTQGQNNSGSADGAAAGASARQPVVNSGLVPSRGPAAVPASETNDESIGAEDEEASEAEEGSEVEEEAAAVDEVGMREEGDGVVVGAADSPEEVSAE